jgi:flagellar basal-body rod protein FlgG
MVRAQYISGTGMLLQRRMMETITNNITNADTTGYKKENLVAHSFDAVMIERINDNGSRSNPPIVGPLTFGTQIDQVYTDFAMGNLEETGRATDLALVGDVFFALDTPNGERYTRAGAFLVDREGYIIDAEGNYLLGENGRIYAGGDEFSVDDAGNVSVEGVYSDTIRAVSFEDNATLRKQGSSVFYATEEPIAPAGRYDVKQGFLENSNVDIAREMVDMITVYRTYETNQRMLTMTDEIVGKAVNDIGRLR